MGITKFQSRLILPTFWISFLIAHSGFLTPDLGHGAAEHTSSRLYLTWVHLYRLLTGFLQL